LSDAWKNPLAKDPLNQPFGWVKAESLAQYPHNGQGDPWNIYGMGRATTWTIKFNMDKDEKGQAALRVALAGSDSTAGLANPGAFGSFDVGVNGKRVGSVQFISTNGIRYNTNKGVWRQYVQSFDASLLKAGENDIEITVPAGEVTSGVIYDYLRLELNEDYKPASPPVTPPGL
jgi:rhamnogalacturonan endolyase